MLCCSTWVCSIRSKESHLNWSQITYEQASYVCKHHDKTLTPISGETLAIWNLAWLFDYKGMEPLDGTLKGITAHYDLSNAQVHGALSVDVSENTYGIKDLAERVGPAEFMDTFMRRPYQQTLLYCTCGQEPFDLAMSAVEHLAGVKMDAVAGAKIIPFARRVA